MRKPGKLEAKAIELIIESIDCEALEDDLRAAEGLSAIKAHKALEKALQRLTWAAEGPFTDSQYEAMRLSEIDATYGSADWM